MNKRLIYILLFPVSVAYGFITSLRNFLFDIGILKSTAFSIPIISIGNITVGGTGKTPLSDYLINLLKDKYKLATLSRGYKRTSKGFLLANDYSKASEIGDEAKQIKRKYKEINVAVCEKRVIGVNEILNNLPETELIILDDAYQHRYIKPGFSILLIDYNRPIFEDFLLPAGRLRENVKQISRADCIIVTKVPNKTKPIELHMFEQKLKIANLQKTFFSSIDYGEFTPVFENHYSLVDKNICKAENYSILLVTGIANSDSIKEYLSGISSNVIELKYPDHYIYRETDLTEIESKFNAIESEKKIIITTEKDAVKIREIAKWIIGTKKKVLYIPIIPVILKNKSEEFNTMIFDYVNKNKRNRTVFTSKIEHYS